jgi:hypothetical protein
MLWMAGIATVMPVPDRISGTTSCPSAWFRPGVLSCRYVRRTTATQASACARHSAYEDPRTQHQAAAGPDDHSVRQPRLQGPAARPSHGSAVLRRVLLAAAGPVFPLVGDDGSRPSHLPAGLAPSEHLTAAATRPRLATATGHPSERSTAPARRRWLEFLEQESHPLIAPSVQGLPRHVRDRTPTITAPSRRAPTSPGSRPLPCTARGTRSTSAPEPGTPTGATT